jgi:putative hydrolase of the HAD superfamily
VSHVGPPAVRGAALPETEAGPGFRPAIFFDLYGTLIDIRTDEDDPRVYAALSQYLAYLNVWIPSEELQQQYRSRVRAFLDRSAERYPEADVYQVFRGLIEAYSRDGRGPGAGRLPDGRPADLDNLALAISVCFRSLTRRSFAVFPQAVQSLERLQTTYRLGLISNAQWVFTDPELEMAGLTRFFPVRILSSRMGVMKPDARIFTEAMRALGATPQQSIYIGDNPERDLLGARNAGMRCILFGAEGSEYYGLRPDAYFSSYADLVAVIDAMCS